MVVATRSSSPRKTPATNTTPKPIASNKTQEKSDFLNPNWGRSSHTTVDAIIGSAFILICAPAIVIYFWMACDSYNCSLILPVHSILKSGGFSSLEAWKSVVWDHLPTPTLKGFQLFFSWLVFQGVFYAVFPAKIGYGQRTPAGHILPYKLNGFSAWLISHLLYVAAVYFDLIPATIIYDNWGSLLFAANCYGFLLAAFSYVKALYFPSHPDDCKFSGSVLYDYVMGVEFNPRFGKLWDFKLFHNGRPGIVAWTMINLSFTAAQYYQNGYVTNSMLLVNFFHFCYVVDFFINEDWYLRTVDIAHDHFGFYLAFGDSVWLPFMYTLQSHFLVRHPVDLPQWAAVSLFLLGMFGYYTFRSVNYQKDIVRRNNGDCMIWGKPAKVIRAKFTTSDGKQHTSILIASGWWGLARHFNYTGDLILSFVMCASCGFGYLLPFFYFIFMTTLLLLRIRRDDIRCSRKYGAYWEEYKKLVPYCLVPYVW